MDSRVRSLRQLIDAELYVVDEMEVATAILARANVRARVPNASFRSEAGPPGVRSFRREDTARSFRLERRSRLH